MKFFLYPVFWVFTMVSCGIICSSLDENNILFFALIGVSLIQFFLIILFLVSKKSINRMLQSCLILVLFFSCGYFLNFLHINNLGYHTKIHEHRGIKFTGKVDECNYSISGYAKVVLEVNSYIENNQFKSLNAKLFLIINDPNQTISQGENIVVFTELEKIKSDETPGAFDVKNYWNRKGIQYMGFVQNENFKKINKVSFLNLTQLLNSFRSKLLSALENDLSGQAASLAKGFLLGDRSDIDSQMLSKFSSTGAMHILAVSGLHIGILVQLLTKCLSLFSRFISKYQAVIFALILVWIYAALTGLSASVVRSVVMFTILSLSTLTGRRYIDINSLFFSAILILLWNPSFLYDVGFQLSYAALFGIFILYPEFVKLITFKNKWVMMAYEGTMVGIAAQITTLPLTLYYFHQFPNYFIVTNLALMAFSFVILLVGCVLFVFYWVVPLKIFLSYILQKVFLFMIFIITKISALPYAVASGFELNWLQVIVLYLIIIALIYFYANKNNRLFNGILFLSFFQFSSLFYSRYQNLVNEKLFILPGKQALSVVRHNSMNYFIYARNSGGNVPNKIKKIAQNFSSVYPGKSEFYNLYDLEKVASINTSFPLEIKNNYNFIQLQLRNKTVRMYKSDRPNNTSNPLNNFKPFYYPLNSLKELNFSLK
jgi:competence protein ComEC